MKLAEFILIGLKTVFELIFVGLAWLDTWISGLVQGWWRDVISAVSGFGSWAYTKITGWWVGLINRITEFYEVAWDQIVEWFTGLTDKLKESAPWAYDLIVGWWNEWVDKVRGIMDIATTIKDMVIGAFNSIVDAIVEIASSIASMIKSAIRSLLPGRGGGGGGGDVSDFIITSNGSVLRTAPDDVIMGMKKNKLGAGGGMGSNVNITVNVHALDAASIDSRTLDKITQAVSSVMKRGLNGRTTESIGVG